VSPIQIKSRAVPNLLGTNQPRKVVMFIYIISEQFCSRKEDMNWSDDSEIIQPANYPTSEEGLTCLYKEAMGVKARKRISESYELRFCGGDNCKDCCVMGCHVT